MNQRNDDPTEQQRERDRLDQLYLQVFEDDKRGQAILADLHRKFVRSPNPSDFTQEGMLRAFVQTHQREVFEYIARRINAAHGVHDEPPPGDET